jgi:hypothetical protein
MGFQKAGAALSAVALAAGLSACGTGSASHPKATAAASSLAAGGKSAAAQITRTPDFKIAEARAQACVIRGGGVLVMYKCIVPPGHSAARHKCVRAVLARNITTKAGRSQIALLIAACEENNP